MLQVNGMPARIVRSYDAVDHNNHAIVVHDLVSKTHKPLLLARGVRLNVAETAIIS